MTDKNHPENAPNHDILIRVGVTPTDILPHFPEGHTEAKIPQINPETLHKIVLSVRIEVLPERSVLPCRE